MSSTVQDVMTTDLVTCSATDSIAEAARQMRDRDIGDVLVTGDDHRLEGIVTDRDLVVRCLADGTDVNAPLGGACSSDIETVSPNSRIDDVVKLMREQALRRVPVVDDGRPVGIVSLGDLAVEIEPDSALGDISDAAPNN